MDKIFIQIFVIVLSIIGIIGNSLVFYILTRPAFIKVPMFRYFIVSNVIGISSLFILWMHEIPIWFNLSVPDVFCKIFLYTMYTAYNFHPWVGVLNSIDRLLALKYQNEFTLIHKFKFQALVVISILVVLMTVNVPFIFYAEVANITQCTVTNIQAGFYINLASLIISILIPFSIMISTTFLIFHFMVTQKKKLNENAQNFEREKGFIKSVLTMDVWFLICYTPLSVMCFLQFTLNINNINPNLWQLLYQISYVMCIIEATFNFFVYFFCNKLFRSYFLSMLACCCRNTNVS